ncbi:methyl-accepting chemotaxis protein [Salibacterium halotolerans]|uniref:Methyl-accepting chemotaxis protein n=1 Tax=Salibacterium halotolerans TaxID=1884432 RepID=A0A1I5SX59_9BACI|nr:methyl-accepting chemotaxis protein [Salibacterium halotolerans]SFP75057.1 methyl-accepting chemotaxis protein [Salibacterium halotolerans]
MRKLNTKLILLTGGLVTVSLLTAAIIIYYQMTDVVEENAADTGMNTVEKEKRYIEQYFETFENHLDMISADTRVTSFLREKSENGPDYSNGYSDVEKVMNRFMYSYDSVELTFTGAANGGTHTTPYVDVEDMDATTRPWYQAAAETPEQTAWTEPYKSEDGGNYVISAGKAVVDPLTNDVVGVVGMDVSLSHLNEMMAEMDVPYNGFMTLIGDSGSVVAHPEQNGTQIEEGESLASVLDTEGSGRIAFSHQNEEYSLFYDRLETNNWVIGTAFSDEAMASESAGIRNTIIIIAAAAIFLSIIITVIISRRITRPVKQMQERVNDMAKGDLTVQFPGSSHEEINYLGRDLNKMAENLRTLAEQVKGSASQVASSSEQFSAVSEETSASGEEVANAVYDISQGAVSQAEEAENTKQEMQILTTAFMFLEEQMKEIENRSKASEEINEAGAAKVSTLTEKAGESQTMMEEVEHVFARLSERLEDIQKAMGSIGDISEQTNLLALNASIEAARAGEHGKGFAVVAEEVRKLADASSASADEVKTILKGLTDEADQVHETVEQSRHVSSEQQDAVQSVKDSFEQIKETGESISSVVQRLLQEIPMMDERRQAVEDAITRIAEVSQSNAASAEEVNASVDEQKEAMRSVASSAESLHEESETLSALIRQFRVSHEENQHHELNESPELRPEDEEETQADEESGEDTHEEENDTTSETESTRRKDDE